MVSQEADILKEHVSKYCVSLEYTIQETIEKIDTARERAVIVLNGADKVAGIISQGDIIRALLRGSSLFSRIDSFVRPNFYYLNERDIERASKIFKENRITLLPVIDSQFKLKDVITISDVYDYLEMKKS